MLFRTLGTVSLLTLAVTGQAREMTLMETVTAQSVASVDLSPNGQYTAVLKYIPRTPYKDDDGSGYTELVLIDAQGNETTYFNRDDKFSRVSFGPNSQYLYFTAKRGDDEYNELYRLPISGGAVQPFYEFEGNIGSYDLSGDGESLIFTSRGKPDADDKKLAKKGFKAEVYEGTSTTLTCTMWTQPQNSQKRPKFLLPTAHPVGRVSSGQYPYLVVARQRRLLMIII